MCFNICNVDGRRIKNQSCMRDCNDLCVCVCWRAAGCGAAQASSVSSLECCHVDSALLRYPVSHCLPLLHPPLQKQQVSRIITHSYHTKMNPRATFTNDFIQRVCYQDREDVQSQPERPDSPGEHPHLQQWVSLCSGCGSVSCCATSKSSTVFYDAVPCLRSLGLMILPPAGSHVDSLCGQHIGVWPNFREDVEAVQGVHPASA